MAMAGLIGLVTARKFLFNASGTATLLLLVAALDISQRTVRKIRQNLFWAFAYNAAGIPLAALGYLNPVIAGAAMAMSSVSVLTNALLLKRWKPEETVPNQAVARTDTD